MTTWTVTESSVRDAVARTDLDVSAQQIGQLTRYVNLLLQWNSTYNLTSITSVDSVLKLHLLDSLSLVSALNTKAIDGKRLLDVGSGGGLPVVPLAVMRPDIDCSAVDAVKKKTVFLKQVSAVCGLKNLHVCHDRVEKLQLPAFDVITSRAFASLIDMVTWTKHLLSENGQWLAMKGKLPVDEIAALPADRFDVSVSDLIVPGLEAQRHLVCIKKK